MLDMRKLYLVLLLGILGCQENREKITVSGVEETMAFDRIRLRDLNEQPVNLAQYRGKTVFINFWATWCKPCMEEMPSIIKAEKKLRDKNVVFLFAANESAEQTRNVWIKALNKFNYTRVENLEDLNIQALPTTFIFNPKGKLVFSEMGSRNWDENTNIDLILKITKQND